MRRSGAFERLGHWLVRHPWYPVVFWVVLAGVALPFLGHISGAEANSATSLPASAPSALASDELARLFPNESQAASSSIVLLHGPGILDPAQQNLTVVISQRIAADPRLVDLAGVSTFYSGYASYLSGMAQLAEGVLLQARPGTAAYQGENASAASVWGPPATFLSDWEGLVSSHPSSPPAQFNAPAYNQTAATLAPDPIELGVLDAFYGHPGSSGWNGTAACAQAPAVARACATTIVRSGTVVPALVPSGMPIPAALGAAIADLDVSNYTVSGSIAGATEASLVNGTALSIGFVGAVRAAFPMGLAPALGTAASLSAWSSGIADTTPVAQYPLTAPLGLRARFVDPAGTATIVEVAYSVPSGYTDGNGTNPVYGDVAEIQRLVQATLVAMDPNGTVQAWQTGDAPLDAQQSQDLAADLAIVLPLTVVVLIGITMVYFRSPITPLVTFGTLGIAIVLSFAGVLAIAATVTKVDPTAITLATTFVLGVGTDYSVFLVARYREELLHGATPSAAVVTTVAWAGQSIATSGATAILATLALAFSGVGLLSQWGIVLSLSVLLTLLASLTLVPAVLAIVGPRLLWPDTGRRFADRARAERERIASHRTYFYRAAARSQRRPRTVVLIALLVSAPLFYVALQAPLSYNFYGQLPSGESASDGLGALGRTFGPGEAFPSFTLVTFQSPLLVGNSTNGTEFTELAQVTDLIATTPGAATVASPVGLLGAPLTSWTNFGNASALERTILRSTLAPFLGIDGRTVSLTFTSTQSGLSVAAVNLVDSVRQSLLGYARDHAGVRALAFGGGAQTTADLEAQTALATERMVAAVSLGLILVLFVVLRSLWIPPMAVATIGLSIGWAWALTYLVIGVGFADPIFYFVPTILFLLILGLGIDYNIFLLTRVREERLAGRPAGAAATESVARTGGIITAAAIILASAFAVLATGRFLLLQTIGFSVAIAIVLDAMVVRTYLVPALLHLGGERVWRLPSRPVRGPPAPQEGGGR
ncbi:MAG TPA: MMPL family transporter [Thermoplasmata archaeon]|nr:MMPL family transporter [Thermoplasmata archaeon]